ncbi:MAG TPA: AAA-associated domain-containing protein [Candidatus Acidoferrum sp.]|nr:AAA-associated domain-containing protein [Candidatus Acidoferrum sp.]
MKLFPPGAKPGQINTLVRILMENEGSISVSRLSKRVHQNIDGLLPVLEACTMLGIAAVSDATVTLTGQGRKLKQSNIDSFIAKGIARIEPFKTAISTLRKEGELSTMELSELLKEHGIKMYTDADVNATLLREELLKWMISYKLMKRNHKRDSWSVRQA